MKRSEIDRAIADSLSLFNKHKISLPFFGYMKRFDWENVDFDFGQIKKTMLGWDVTDFGSDDFNKIGAVLFTLRNGDVYDKNVGTPYAEKYIILKAENGQEIPMHYHINKTEDIINRAGGTLLIQVYGSHADKELDLKNDIVLYLDGVKTTFKPGAVIEVKTGASVTLTPYVYHRFYVKDADTVIGEVSSINDDNTDNVFYNPAERFMRVCEDVSAKYVLVNEYR